jgi:hypothetical protein
MGELLEVVRAIEGPIGHQRGGAIGEGSRMNGPMDDLAARMGITAVATARLHQEGETRLVLHDQRPHHLVEVRPMIAAVAPRDVHDVCIGRLVAGVAAIDMDTGALEGGKGRGQPATLGCSRCHETVAFSDTVGIARLQRSA